MYCKHCGREVKQGQRFCGKCGRIITSQRNVGRANRPATPPKKEPRRKWVLQAILLGAAAVLMVVAVFAVVSALGGGAGNHGGAISQTHSLENGNLGEQASAEESFGQYSTFHEGISDVEREYLDESGFVEVEDIPELIKTVAAYVQGLPSDMVASYDVGEDYVQVDLVSGVTYVYSPPRKNMMNRGDGVIIGSYEQETEAFSEDRDNAIDSFDLRAKPNEVGVLGNSLLDTIAWYLVDSDSNQFHLDEFYDDEEVTLDVIKGFQSDRLILWEGHGLWTEQLGPQLQLSQEIDTSWWAQLWGDDFRERRIVACGDHIAVTSAFFSHYYKAGDLQDSIIYLGSCYSLRDDRLASVLNAKGASLIVGNSNPVSSFYQYEMRDSILADMADYRIPISQALKDARLVYGDEDPWCAKGEHTKVMYYPSTAGSVTLYGADEEQRPKDGSEKRHTNYEYFATNLIEDMYNDWSFEGGRQILNNNPFPGRCLRYIDKDSQLYSDFVEAGINTSAKYARSISSCVVGEPEVELTGERTCKVTVDYVFTQESVDREAYDRLLKDVQSDTWIVTMNDACKVIDLARKSSIDQVSNDGHAPNIEAIAEEFVKVWYNDWTFENGEMKTNQTPHSERCLTYIAEGTELYSEFSDEKNFYAGSGSRLSRGAALSVATIDTTLEDNNTVAVDVAFYGAQNTVTQEMFDRLKEYPPNQSTWTLTFDDSGKITKLEDGVVAESESKTKADAKETQSESAQSANQEAIRYYQSALQRVMGGGSWHESVELDMPISGHDSKGAHRSITIAIRTEADISGYRPDDFSELRVSGTVWMDNNGSEVQGDYTYENGELLTRASKPNQASNLERGVDPKSILMIQDLEDLESHIVSASKKGNTVHIVLDSGSYIWDEVRKTRSTTTSDMMDLENMDVSDIVVDVTIDDITGEVYAVLSFDFSASEDGNVASGKLEMRERLTP